MAESAVEKNKSPNKLGTCNVNDCQLGTSNLRTSVNWELRCENYGKNYSGTVETMVDSTAGLDL